MTRRYAWLLAWAVLGAPAAQAQTYIGAGLSSISADIQGDAQAAFADIGLPCNDPFLSCSFDGSDRGFKVFGGHRFGASFAVEGFYADLGKATARVRDGGSTVSYAADSSAFGVAALGFVPVAHAFEVFGKFGFARWSTDVRIHDTTSGGTLSDSDDGTDPFFGAGAQWNGNGFSLRGEFERFDRDGTDVDVISLSAILLL